MPYKSWSVNEEVFAADFNNYVQKQVVATFPTSATRTTSLAGPQLNQLSMLDTAPGAIDYWNGNAWAPVKGSVAAAQVAAGESTASGSYVDLATVGPAVSLVTGTSVLLTLSTRFVGTGAGVTGLITYAVTGATTIAAADNNAIYMPVLSSGNSMDFSRQFVITGLTAGLNTFTAKYRESGGVSVTFTMRALSVVIL